MTRFVDEFGAVGLSWEDDVEMLVDSAETYQANLAEHGQDYADRYNQLIYRDLRVDKGYSDEQIAVLRQQAAKRICEIETLEGIVDAS